MNLPINIDDILYGKSVEWERLEFKKSWNPEAIMHTMCAFANDFHNLGGGYIVIGIAENKGRPVLPPSGISSAEIDKIQKDIIQIGHRIQPDYHPIIAPYEVDGKLILILWSGGGQTRPYKAPVSMSRNCRDYAYYIRKASATVKARHHDEVELINMAATVPFDDRIHHTASLDDLDFGMIRTFLRQIGSGLYEESSTMDFLQLCRQMNIVDGPDEFIRPKNIGLMFFNETPDKFFPQAQIDVVQFPEGPGADIFTEKIFKGSLDRMLKEALNYIQSILIEERVIKYPDRPEADRFFNYPFEAIEEALVNAVYHRSYDVREPVEVRILPDSVTICSHAGLDRSIHLKDLESKSFLSRRYRNRRIGEFLKELDMTEGRGTGIPKIRKALKRNQSPPSIFHADEDRTYFAVEYPIHPAFIDSDVESGNSKRPEAPSQVSEEAKAHDEAHDEAHEKTTKIELEILTFCLKQPQNTSNLLSILGYKTRTGNFKKAISSLLDRKLLERTIADKPRSKNQKYRLTAKGKAAITNGGA